ncbi:MAG: radical SAM protein [Patescibacteria group bacterium]
MEKVLNATPKYFSLTSKNISNNDFLYLALLYQYIGCPHECLKCFNDDDVPTKSFYPIYLSLQERKSLIDEAKDMGGKVIIFAGLAEPLTHMHSASLIKYTAEKGLIPIVYSNGFELDTSMINYLKDNNAVVAMSLDSLDPYRFGVMAKPKSKMYFPDYYKKIIGNMENCIDIYGDTIKYENGVKVVNTAIISTICKINEDEIVEIKNHFGDDTYFVCNPLAYEGGAIKNWPILMGNLNSSPDHHMQIIKECSESGGPLTFFNKRCGYSNNGLAVYPDGTYATCAYTSKTNGYLGNTKNATIKDAFLKKHKIEQSHYEQFGDCSCLVRSSNFDKYVKSLF